MWVGRDAWRARLSCGATRYCDIFDRMPAPYPAVYFFFFLSFLLPSSLNRATSFRGEFFVTRASSEIRCCEKERERQRELVMDHLTVYSFSGCSISSSTYPFRAESTRVRRKSVRTHKSNAAAAHLPRGFEWQRIPRRRKADNPRMVTSADNAAIRHEVNLRNTFPIRSILASQGDGRDIPYK